MSGLMRFFSRVLASGSAGTPGSNGCTATSRSSSCGIWRCAWNALTCARGFDSCTTQALATIAAQAAAASAPRLLHRILSLSSRNACSARAAFAPSLSLGILLVVEIFLPKLFLQLRVGLLLRRLAQPSGDDVIVAPIGDLARAGAVAGVVIALARLLGFQIPRRVMAPRRRTPAPAAAVRVGALDGGAPGALAAFLQGRCGGRGVGRCVRRRRGLTRVALLRDLLLLLAQPCVEGAE